MPLVKRHIIYGDDGERIGHIRIEYPSRIACISEFKADRKLTRNELKRLHEKLMRMPSGFIFLVKGLPMKFPIELDPDGPRSKDLPPPYTNDLAAALHALFDKQGKLLPMKKNRAGIPINPLIQQESHQQQKDRP